MTIHADLIKQKAGELGFDACGIAMAGKPGVSHQARFDQWLAQGFHGRMAYMERNRDKRFDLQALYPGAKSVIVLAHNYHPRQAAEQGDGGLPVTGSFDDSPGSGPDQQLNMAQHDPDETSRLRVSGYAYGLDYHFVIKKKLMVLIRFMEEMAAGTHSRGFTDSAPVLERAWAVEAGLGWTGKNACLIIPKKGSYFFLAEIVTTLELEPDQAFGKNHCGSCTRCLDACPTQAIVAPGQIDARRCISYQTIENKGPIPQDIKEKSRGWIFGCDICQEVCPHNRFSRPHAEPLFDPLHGIDKWTERQWRSLQKDDFEKYFVKGGSPIGRISYEKLMDNMRE